VKIQGKQLDLWCAVDQDAGRLLIGYSVNKENIEIGIVDTTKV
jgi:hypothetical protein